MKPLVATALCLVSFPVLAQTDRMEVVLENPEVQVTRYAIDPQNPLQVTFTDGDGVVVPMQGVKWSAAISANSESEAATVLAVHLKHHWAAMLRKCEDQCARPIKIEDHVIGETRSLFTNHYVSAYRHELDRGGSLSSSYFTSHGNDHVLLIALTPLAATVSGDRIWLEPGQAYFSTTQDVEANAEHDRAVWVAIRIHAPDEKRSE